MALSIGGFPFLFSGTRETRHFFDAVQMTAQRSVLGTAAADSKIHHGCMFFALRKPLPGVVLPRVFEAKRGSGARPQSAVSYLFDS
ncbi:MAG: hypothetical protein KJZ76_13705 [Burkholderiaceae bacterium]|nr:hypothetical protein [Burkholderiaceae bacterium]